MTERQHVSPTKLLHYYKQILRIRRFEERVVDLVNLDEIPGITHEYIGQEAVAVGVADNLDERDRITSTHRGHGHAIARGVSLHSMFSELMGKQTGPNRGRGGSMHVTDVSVGHLGANGIVGAGTPMACGAAFALKSRGRGGVVASFFGDGGINQGVVLESWNLAAVWELPVLFVCENNFYAVSTPISSTAARPMSERAQAFGLAVETCDGMDVLSVAAAAGEMLATIRSTNRPGFLQCDTYRFSGHHTAEALQGLEYRDSEEIAEWRKRDPLDVIHKRLADDGYGDASLAIRQAVEAELDRAITQARIDPFPASGTELFHMYASGHTVEPGK